MTRLIWPALVLASVVCASGCDDGTGSGDGPEFGPRRQVSDAFGTDRRDAGEPDVGFVRVCEDGETRACGLDEGECSAGAQRCVQGTWAVACEDEVLPGEELCNGLDDDCDGLADEAFAIGARCKTRNELNQEVDGTWACEMGTGMALCVELPDCDEDADGDGFDVCVDCDDDDRDNHPGNEERCDGRDNDCDELIDEPFQLGTLCYSGDGVCRRGGQTVCAPRGLETMCDAVPDEPAEAELCGDEDDNDCDGETDEGFEVDVECIAGAGACAVVGVTRCSVDGTELECDVEAGEPTAERCGSGVDEDCDGLVDEGFVVGGPCRAGNGACAREGNFVCSEDGLDVVCDAEVAVANLERCGNGQDDDCDGRADEGFDLGEACAAGLGACERVGVLACNQAGDGVQCTATPGEPGAERCGNDIDEDCDGVLDEGFGLGVPCSNGVGACRRDAVTVCALNGREVVCGGEQGAPEPERCDFIDNDCDERVDEGFPLGEACSNGVGACARDGEQVCTPEGDRTICDARPGPPGVELCNGEDEDCDERVDEGFDLGGACDGPDPDQCDRGVIACDPLTNGTACVDDEPSPELCNFLDDDCDGVVDNGIDLFSDPLNCGNCGIVCPGPGPECIDGACYRTYWVDDDLGSNADGDGSSENPWRTLSHALGVVRGPRARVYVRPGLYDRELPEPQGFPMLVPDGVQIVGFGPRAEVVLDARHRESIFIFSRDVDPANLVRGLTVRRGGAVADRLVRNRVSFDIRDSFVRIEDVSIEDAGDGAAYSALNIIRSEVIIEDSQLVRNSGGSADGIVLVSGSRVTMERTHFQDNEAGAEAFDGVIMNTAGELFLRNCSFAGSIGSAVRTRDGADVELIHNSFAGSTQSGIALGDSGRVVLVNNIFAHNGRAGIEQVDAGQDPVVMVNNLFFGNEIGPWSVLGEGIRDMDAANAGVGEGNFSADPAFISLVAGNLRLREGSGAVDRASPDYSIDVDQDGRARPRGDAADVGAYESFLEP